MAFVNNPYECLRGRNLVFSDYASDIASEVAENQSPSYSRPITVIEEGLDFILTHFKEGFPRTISTKTTEGRQIVVYSKEEALARFKAANYLDCKINAYPRFVEWKRINRQPPNFIFIDLDQGGFKLIDKVLDKTLKNICQKFNTEVHPTVIWSGHGYHIYLPVEAFVLEQESEFANLVLLLGNSYSSQRNFYRTRRLIHAILKDYLLRIVCYEYQDHLIQRMVLKNRLGLSKDGTVSG